MSKHTPEPCQGSTDANARLNAAAPDMYESLRDAVLFMQFLGKRERPLSAEEQEWLKKAVLLLDKIEGGGE